MTGVDLIQTWSSLSFETQLWVAAIPPFLVFCAMGLCLDRVDFIIGMVLRILLPKPLQAVLMLKSSLEEGPPRGLARYLQPFGTYVPGDEEPEWKERADAAVDAAVMRRRGPFSSPFGA